MIAQAVKFKPYDKAAYTSESELSMDESELEEPKRDSEHAAQSEKPQKYSLDPID